MYGSNPFLTTSVACKNDDAILERTILQLVSNSSSLLPPTEINIEVSYRLEFSPDSLSIIAVALSFSFLYLILISSFLAQFSLASHSATALDNCLVIVLGFFGSIIIAIATFSLILNIL